MNYLGKPQKNLFLVDSQLGRGGGKGLSTKEKIVAVFFYH